MQTRIHTIEFAQREQFEVSDPSFLRIENKSRAIFQNEFFTGWCEVKLPQAAAPVDPAQYIKTPVFAPQAAARSWLGAQLVYSQPTGTEIFLRIVVDGNDYWFDGGSWQPVSNPTVDFNTVEEFENNFAQLPVTEEGIAFKIFMTTDGTDTAKVFAVKVAWSGMIQEFEEMLIDSLVPKLKAVETYGDIVVKAGVAGTVIGFDPATLLEGFNFTGIVTCFNYTSDTKKIKNIFQSYDSGAKQITLTEAVAQTDKVFVQFTFTPAVQIAAHQDFYEVAKFPCITVDDIDEVGNRRTKSAVDYCVIGVNGEGVREGVRIEVLRQLDFDINLTITTTLNVDQTRLTNAVLHALEEDPVLHLVDTDERCVLVIISFYKSRFNAQRADLRRSEIAVRVFNMPVYSSAESVLLPDRFNMTFLTEDAEQ